MSPAGPVAQVCTGEHLERLRQTDWRHGVVQLDRMRQLQQHEIAGHRASWTIKLVIHEDLRDGDTPSIFVVI